MLKITATHYIHDLKVEIIDINATDAPYRVTNLVTGESWECLVESIAWHNCATLLRGTKSNQDYLLYSLNHPDHEAVLLATNSEPATKFKVQMQARSDGFAWSDIKSEESGYTTPFLFDTYMDAFNSDVAYNVCSRVNRVVPEFKQEDEDVYYGIDASEGYFREEPLRLGKESLPPHTP